MAQLAIKGHPNRGKEVIEILKMLGGINAIEHCGNNANVAYYIKETYKNWIDTCYPINLDGFIILTLEGFLKKYPYKVGDKVFAFGNKCTIIGTVWDESINEVVYTIKLDASKYTTTKLSYQLQSYKEETIKIDIPKGYEFAGVDDDNQQVVFERIGCQYPKTYEECCEVLSYEPDRQTVTGYDAELIENLQTLKLCRDAYWKIAGKEMGLGKPWKPNFTNDDEERYGIYTSANKVEKEFYGGGDINTILTFPTEEMRDTFCENFKELIESCKELL